MNVTSIGLCSPVSGKLGRTSRRSWPAPQWHSRPSGKDVGRNPVGHMSKRTRKVPIEILGVYRVSKTEPLVLRMLKAHWGGRVTPKRRELAMPRINAVLGGLVLVEARVFAPCIGKLEHATATAGAQVPWQVTQLSADGRQVVRRLFLDEPDEFPARVAFFLHCFTPHSPLADPSGSTALPRPRRMSVRLASLIEYQPVD